MARIGKIARLPRAVRSQLNSRLQNGEEGKQIVSGDVPGPGQF